MASRPSTFDFWSGWFNQSLDNVTWPAGLQSLTFGDQLRSEPGQRDMAIAGLQSLTFGDGFDQSLDNVTWPAGLESLTFGENFSQGLGNITWPVAVQSLTFVRNHQSLQDSDVLPGALSLLAIGEMMSLKCWTSKKKGGFGEGEGRKEGPRVWVGVYFKALVKLQGERTLRKSPRKNDLDNSSTISTGYVKQVWQGGPHTSYK